MFFTAGVWCVCHIVHTFAGPILVGFLVLQSTCDIAPAPIINESALVQLRTLGEPLDTPHFHK